MTDIGPYLDRLGLQQYYDVFIKEGFDTWETTLDIQESDLEALNVKLGHRRKLQRAIIEFRSIPRHKSLEAEILETLPHDSARLALSTAHAASSSTDGTNPSAPEIKRRYRRHPKADEHAPERPPSAYVLFSNHVREGVKRDNLSFTEIARLVGERWQKSTAAQREPYETHANALKESYNAALSQYKRTDEYRGYNKYLAEFRLKHGYPTDTKRPRLDAQYSSSMSAASVADAIDPYSPLAQQTYGGVMALPNETQESASAKAVVSPGLSSSMSFPAPNAQRLHPAARVSSPQLASQVMCPSERSSRGDIDLPLAQTASSKLDSPFGTPSTAPFIRQSSRSEVSTASAGSSRVIQPTGHQTDASQMIAASDLRSAPSSTIQSSTGGVHQQQCHPLLTQPSGVSLRSPLFEPSSASPVDTREVSRILPPLHQITSMREPGSLEFELLQGGLTSTGILFQSCNPLTRTQQARALLRPEDEAADALATLADNRGSDKTRNQSRSYD